MDEPTNHLDLEGILWLERLLKNRAKAFLVISHDRRFLESVTSRMVELNRCYPEGRFEARGCYSDFLEQRDAALQAQADYQASFANRVRREVEWLRRGPKARTTKAKGRIQSAGKLIDELNQAESRAAQSTIGIDFSASGRKSKQLVVRGAGQQELQRHTRRDKSRPAPRARPTAGPPWPERQRQNHPAAVAGRDAGARFRHHHASRRAAYRLL